MKQQNLREVGYVGSEVDSIIRDLTDSAMKLVRQTEIEKNRFRAEEMAEERVLDVLLPPAKDQWGQIEEREPIPTHAKFFKRNYVRGNWTIVKLKLTLPHQRYRC